uniref:Glutathione peroxidase n=2 Tax=Plectus sambesii TaxID=2011161 RepID=A0A914WP49_9BILA
MTHLAKISAVLLLLACAVRAQVASTPRPGPAVIDESTRWTRCNTTRNVYDFQMSQLDGRFTDLTAYRGKVLLIINVATFCAYTQQYLDFNGIIDRYKAQNFTILAFPCNQFYLQEPAENHELLNGLMHVRPGNGWKPHTDMKIFGKLEVNGANHHPLYEFVKGVCPQTVNDLGIMEELMYNPVRANDVTWNFEKYLIDRKGVPRFRFHPTAWSNGRVVTPYIEQLLRERA